MARFLCTVDYAERKGHEVLVEVWITNDRPAGATERDEVEEVLRQFAHGGTVPEGWNVSSIAWQHPAGGKSGMDGAKFEAFSSLIDSSEVTVEDDDGTKRRKRKKRRRSREDEDE